MFPQYSIGSLVTYNDEIHEVISFKPSPDGYKYTLEIRAFLRDMTQEEWEDQIEYFRIEVNESNLQEFKYKKPKFSFADRVTLNDNKCVVKFIKFENYNYKYEVMSESYWKKVSGGWRAEEDYLSK